jgi:hypothetical protein
MMVVRHSSLHEEKFKKLIYTKNVNSIQSCSAAESYGETYVEHLVLEGI